jgi:hypothetical protein
MTLNGIENKYNITASGDNINRHNTTIIKIIILITITNAIQKIIKGNAFTGSGVVGIQNGVFGTVSSKCLDEHVSLLGFNIDGFAGIAGNSGIAGRPSMIDAAAAAFPPIILLTGVVSENNCVYAPYKNSNNIHFRFSLSKSFL